MTSRCALLALALCGLGACTDETPSSNADTPTAAGVPLPDGRFEGVDEEGEEATLRLADLRGGPTDHALVVITGGLWCGTCQWLAAPTEAFLGAESAARLARFDLVLGDRDNGVPTREAARAWQARGVDAPVGADPDHALASRCSPTAARFPSCSWSTRETSRW